MHKISLLKLSITFRFLELIAFVLLLSSRPKISNILSEVSDFKFWIIINLLSIYIKNTN